MHQHAIGPPGAPDTMQDHEASLGPDTSWPPRRLTVVYDDTCELCVRCARWLAEQPTLVDLRFLASSEPDVYDLYGDLPWFRLELMVATDGGDAWVGSDAFVMCLWATTRWRSTSFTLSSDHLSSTVERFVHALSAGRSVVSGLLTPTTCATGACGEEHADALSEAAAHQWR